jgi:poly(glycerol-phosphate) alpha-glucosyltransferase
MKVALLTASVSRRGGGLFEIVRRLGQTLAVSQGVDVHLFGLRDEFTRADLDQCLPLVPRLFDVQGPQSFGFARHLVQSLCDADLDLVNTHGLWMYPSAACVSWARRTQRPHVVSVQGMLEPWALRRSRWKKGIARVLYECTHLRTAACLQVNSLAEAAHIKEIGLRRPIAVIVNGVDLQPAAAGPPPWHSRLEMGCNVLLFLGRLHPKKGLVPLLHAWAWLRHSENQRMRNWMLVIAGWDQDSHEEKLKTLAQSLRIDDAVCFIGPQFAAAKHAAFAHAAAFVLPSQSEGLPMAVLEAMAHALPVIITPGCNMHEAVRAGAGLAITTEPENMAEALASLFDMTDAERRAMGARGRRLVADRFTWSRVAEEMRSVYDWILGGGQPPSCVLEFHRAHRLVPVL